MRRIERCDVHTLRQKINLPELGAGFSFFARQKRMSDGS
jgi:predicted nuclease of restriction endonuclease-like (RecB) superfamily